MRPEGREIRRLALAPTIRAADAAGEAPHIVGYAAKFGGEYRVFGPREPVIETIAPGAFARTLREMPDIRALYNHDTSAVLGRTSSGTLTLAEDATGLHFDCELPDTTVGRDVRTLIGRGDITGCSFGFSIVEYSIKNRADGVTLMVLEDVDLYEISPAVAFPAYEETEVALRARERLTAKPQLRSRPALEWARRRLQLDS